MNSTGLCKVTGEEIDDNELIEILKAPDAEVYVGSDSHLIGGLWQFATVLCIYYPGRGGRYFISKEKRTKSEYRSLRDRLFAESMASVNLATQINDLTGIVPTIHLDVSNNLAEGSGRFAGELSSTCRAMGFPVEIKPNSWASSTIADKGAR